MLEIVQYDFMLRSFIAGTIIALIAPVVGMFLVVRRYSYLADTLAHVSLVGVAAALVSGTSPVIGAMIAAVVSAFGIEELRTKKKILSDSLLAIFLSGSLALAIVLVNVQGLPAANLFSYLFGAITTVNASELVIMGSVGAFILLFVFLFRRSLFLVAFDEELAEAEGTKARWYNVLMVVLAALIVSLSIRIVGALLIGALIVIPVISAMQWKKDFRATMAMAIVFSFISVYSGLYLSFILDLASGGTIVLSALLLFTASLTLKK